MTPEEVTQTEPTTPTTPEPTTTLLNEPEKSLVNADVKKDEPPKPVVPEKYADFKLPDGYELDKGVMDEFAPVFKKAGISQEVAQELVDLYSKHAIASQEESMKLWKETRESWINEVKADPEIGGKLDQVKTTISKAIDGLGDPKLATAFREAMDYTSAGNNPAFIKAFYKMASKLTEGSHVSGRGPVEIKANNLQRPSLAEAMYPGGPRSDRVGPT
jgi:hypothetical protein